MRPKRDYNAGENKSNVNARPGDPLPSTATPNSVAAAARAALRQTRQVLLGAAALFALLTAAYLWSSWKQASREAWGELRGLSNLAQSTAQIHFDQYARGMEQLSAQVLLLQQSGKDTSLMPLLEAFLHAYPDLTGVVLVRPDGRLLTSSAAPDAATQRKFNTNPKLMQMLAAMRERRGLQFFPPVISPLTHVPVIRLGYPALDQDGKVGFYVVAGLNLERQTLLWRSLLTKEQADSGFGLGIMSQEGRLLERWPLPPLPAPQLVEFLGQVRSGAIHQALLRNPGAQQAPIAGRLNIGQGEIFWGMFKRLQGYPAAAFVVMPRALAVQGWWRRVRLPLLLEVLAVAGFAWLVRRTLKVQQQVLALTLERRAQEERQAAQHARLERLQGLYQALLSAGDVILKSSSDIAMLNDICSHLAQCGLFAAAWVARPDAEGRFHSLAASAADAYGSVEQLALSAQDATGPVGRAWLSGRLEYNNDHRDDPSLASRLVTLQSKGWVSGVAVPLRRGGKPYAILGLAGRQIGMFDDEVLALAAQVGRQLGGGLDELDLKLSLEEERSKQGFLARHDALTGLPNRLALLERLPQALARARRSKTLLAIGIMDLDDFKPVNDTWGHAAGDAILQELGRRLRGAVRETDLVARLGGDEFAFILEGLTQMACLPIALARIHATVEEPFILAGGRSARVGLSLGVTLYPQDGADVDTLLSHADTALYGIKANKSGRTGWWQQWQPPAP